MHSHCRREFLVRSAAATAGLLTGGAVLQSPLARAAQALAGPADMTIAKFSGQNATPEQIRDLAVKLTEQAIAGLGGIERFVHRGDVVWIKPNIGWDRTPEYAANTNPDVVATLVKMCFNAGAKKVKVGDNPCDVAQKTYENSGIAPAVRPLGAEVVFLDRSRFKETNIAGEQVKLLPVYPEVMECDLVINVPVVKHHVLASSTMCMKNYMGVIEARKTFHQALPICIADLTRFMKPKLCVLDAVRILTNHGPRGGKLEDVATKLTVAAGVDIVALDAWGAEVMGKSPSDIGSIVKGQETGLGKMDYRSLKLKEIAVS